MKALIVLVGVEAIFVLECLHPQEQSLGLI